VRLRERDIGYGDIWERDVGESDIRQRDICERDIGERDNGKSVTSCKFAEQLLIHIHLRRVSGCLRLQ